MKMVSIMKMIKMIRRKQMTNRQEKVFYSIMGIFVLSLALWMNYKVLYFIAIMLFIFVILMFVFDPKEK